MEAQLQFIQSRRIFFPQQPAQHIAAFGLLVHLVFDMVEHA
jgi:hypothetical protein